MFDKSVSALMASDLDWGLVGSTVVTGLVIVFLILAILVFFLWGFGKIFKAINSAGEKRERKKLIKRDDSAKSFKLDNGKPAPASPAAPAAEITPETSAEEEYEDEDDDEIIAVIAAAIAAYGAADGKQYRITRVQRPKSARSGWSAAGIAENMRGFID
ncbi:MAG: OadG family protein [Ruminiclostridium sp.]|nr:OadG family protein [Ruminiclostridium sp.]